MGGIDKLLGFLPFSSQIKQMVSSKADFTDTHKQIAIIKSMTPKERKNPDLVRNFASRRTRITKGSGTKLADVNRLIKKLDDAKIAAKRMKNMGGKFDNETISKIMKNGGLQDMNMDGIDIEKIMKNMQ